MKRRRACVSTAMAFSVAATGMTAVTASPAAAAAGNTTVSCSRLDNDPDAGGDDSINCVISDPDGVRSVLSVTTDPRTSGGFDGSFICQFPDPPTTHNLKLYPAQRFRLFVTDCDQPRNHANYVVRADGTVREIRDN